MLVSHYQETEKDDPSRVSEEAMLDSLFHACDTEHSGRVSVSKLIDYLRNAISNGSEEVRPILWSTLLFSFAFLAAYSWSIHFHFELVSGVRKLKRSRHFMFAYHTYIKMSPSMFFTVIFAIEAQVFSILVFSL